MTAYYNEIDPYAAQWLRNLIDQGLIARGDVDERSIVDVRPDDLRGYTQCHWFAGIGGWSVALRLAGWPDDRPVWTGSCPCQPFSTSGRQRGFSDERHLWPDWVRLIRERMPSIVFGEQVARSAAWFRLVRGDLEFLAYAVGAMPIEAASAGAPELRDRLFFVAALADATCGGWNVQRAPTIGSFRRAWSAGTSCSVALGADRTVRRVEPGIPFLADGLPVPVAARRAFGNAIVPQTAAEFIAAADGAMRENR